MQQNIICTYIENKFYSRIIIIKKFEINLFN